MFKSLVTVSLLAVLSAPALFAVGCASDSDSKAYNLTGDNTSNRALTSSERQRYTDSKGHFRPDWVQSGR